MVADYLARTNYLCQ